MKLTIVKHDGLVGIDGVFFAVDLSALPANLRAVQHNGIHGHEEWTDQGNTFLQSVDKYQSIVEDALAAKALQEAKAADPYYRMSQQEKAAKQREEAINKIASDRYAMEIGGVTIGGMVFLTDRESVQILDSTAEKIRRGFIQSVVWKCANGWTVLNKSNIDAIEIAVLTHVQTAFMWEKSELDKLS